MDDKVDKVLAVIVTFFAIGGILLAALILIDALIAAPILTVLFIVVVWVMYRVLYPRILNMMNGNPKL